METAVAVVDERRREQRVFIGSYTEEELQEVREELVKYIEQSDLGQVRIALYEKGRQRMSNQNDVASRAESQAHAFAIHDVLKKNITMAMSTISAIDEGWDGVCTCCGKEVVPLRRVTFALKTICVSCQRRLESGLM